MEEDHEQWLVRRIAEEMRESRRALLPFINEMARIHAMELPGRVVMENGMFSVEAKPVELPPAIQEFFDRERERLEARVSALQAGQRFSLGQPIPAAIGRA